VIETKPWRITSTVIGSTKKLLDFDFEFPLIWFHYYNRECYFLRLENVPNLS